MQHICNNICINLKTLDKSNFKKNRYNILWGATRDINIYWKCMDKLTKKLDARDIVTSDDKKISVAVAQMWESDYFIEEIIIKW